MKKQTKDKKEPMNKYQEEIDAFMTEHNSCLRHEKQAAQHARNARKILKDLRRKVPSESQSTLLKEVVREVMARCDEKTT